MAQVDQIALVTAGKVVGGQLFLGLLQAAPHRPGIGSGVVVQQAVAGLQVQNIIGIQQLHTAAHLQGNLPATAALDALERPLQLSAELVVADGLEHEVQGIHLVPADGVLGHVGDEHQHHIRIHLTDAFGGRHAAQGGHLDVQEDNVKAGAVGVHDLGPIGKSGHVQLAAAFPGILGNKSAKLLPHGVVVFHYGDFSHFVCPLPGKRI